MNTQLVVASGGVSLPAALTLPEGMPCAGIVTLHPASGPSRDYFLFGHLAAVAATLGIAVLSYDRRPPVGDDDVPFELQADDAVAAVALLRERVGPDTPVGLWAFSQGGWVAPLVAARGDIAFLILVGASGVTPGEQMLYSVGEAVTRAGHGPAAAVRARESRAIVHAYLGGETSREAAQAAIDTVAEEPWFELLWLPRTLPQLAPGGPGWTDKDFDPASAIAGVRCPVLLIYGDDEAVPPDASIEVWRRSASSSLEVARLARSHHVPTTDGAQTTATIDPEYEAVLRDRLEEIARGG